MEQPLPLPPLGANSASEEQASTDPYPSAPAMLQLSSTAVVEGRTMRQNDYPAESTTKPSPNHPSAACCRPFLLVLLDGVLGRDHDRIASVWSQIVAFVRRQLPDYKVQQLLHGMPGVVPPSSWDNPPRVTPSLSSPPVVYRMIHALLAAGGRDAVTTLSEHDGSLPLHFAASLGDVPIASLILSQYPEAASTPNEKGKIPLHYAAREGRNEMVDYLLSVEPQTARIATTKRKLAIHFAAGDGHVNVVRSLLRVHPKGASTPSAKGKLPIHFAARWNHLQIVQDLLNEYPDGVRAMDHEGSVPLHESAREGQYETSRYLLERFPSALVTANLRNEIPLFSAVRSDNLDLIILFLLAWPVGGKHILQNISKDDNVTNWDWNVLELVLRGAVGGNFAGITSNVVLERFRSVKPPTIRLVNDISAIKVPEPPDSPGGKSGKKKRNREKSRPDSSPDSSLPRDDSDSQRNEDTALLHQGLNELGGISEIELAGGSSATHGPYLDVVTEVNSDYYLKEPFCRSKSPILVDDSAHLRKRPLWDTDCPDADEGKCCGTRDCGGSSVKRRQLKTAVEGKLHEFIPLHAAMECGASCHVIRHVLSLRRNIDLRKIDHFGRTPLHWAVTLCAEGEDEFVEMILSNGLIDETSAASRDYAGNLPLHLAIRSRADARIIEALLAAYPSSGVDSCCTNDYWHSTKPIHMACHFDCEVSTVYRLLRVDPGALRKSLSSKEMD